MRHHAARRAGFLLFSAAFSVAGCVRYEPKPLDDDAVARNLATPDAPTLQAKASQLTHPILKPLTIDLARGVSPDEAAVIAVIVNPQLRAERDQRGIAAAQLLQAGLLPNPQLVGGLDIPYDSSPPDNFTGYSIGPEWEITSLITRDARRRAASSVAKSVALDVAWKEWQVAQEARAAAYDVLALEAQLAAAREAHQQFAENLAVVRRTFDRHDATLLDLSAAETSARDAHVVVVEQERALVRQRLIVRRSLGFGPQDAAIAIHADSGSGELPSRLDPPKVGELLAGLESRRLDLVALKRGYDSQDATLRAAVLAQFPKITLGLNAAADTGNVKTIGIGVSADLPIFDRNQGNIRIESATRQKLFDEYAARTFAARWEIATAVTDIETANVQIAVVEAAIPALDQLVRAYESALRQGHVDILSYYTARGALAQKRIDVVKLKQQLIASWVALELASGQYLPMRAATATSPTTQEARP
ncbi:MAG: outer membrane protein heavy metal efflux system [Phycisphaerales bacterium]|jgi:outer membrane protein TolC|nr:outer membrane protein heavy metal efflux system [Phycisphaerales bacterium]